MPLRIDINYGQMAAFHTPSAVNTAATGNQFMRISS
ncbi:unnamed protein product [Haemonchus placei]|uniref:Uncharacterized protein n=1 Tax=Haemonchus placei TaxID=6290 RepID=A0A0N4VW51_HAEPC|nr:unnamed protein product [Haemonchus placei]